MRCIVPRAQMFGCVKPRARFGWLAGCLGAGQHGSIHSECDMETLAWVTPTYTEP